MPYWQYLVDEHEQVQEIRCGGDDADVNWSLRKVGSKVCDPYGVEGIFELNTPFAKVKHKKEEEQKQDKGEVLPIGQETISFAVGFIVVDKVLSSKHKPECHQARIEDSLRKK